MSLLEQSRIDNQFITSNTNDFGVAASFQSHVGSETATVGVLHTKHHLKVDYDGMASNLKIASVGVNETLLNAQNYPTRSNGEVKMEGDIVTVKDSTDNDVTYVVNETFADEALGLIILILGDIDS